jgi:hypothetical protein
MIVEAMIGICVHDPDVLIEPPSNVRDTAVTALGKQMGGASLPSTAHVAFMMAHGGLPFAESEEKASRDLQTQIGLVMLQRKLLPSDYSIKYFSESLRSDIKILWAAAILGAPQKKWWEFWK